MAAALSQPLAADEVQARFWVRHARIGVALSCVSAALIAVYALATAGQPHRLALLAVAVVVVTGSPPLLLLPLRSMVLDRRGGPFFYAWSSTLTVLIAVAAALDGESPQVLALLFVLTLTYAGLAYPPSGVTLLGCTMVASHAVVTSVVPVAVSSAPEASVADTWIPVGVLAVVTAMFSWAAHNRWDAQEQQVMLTQALETMASTDPLTGCLNRRAFLRRLTTGIADPRPLSTLYLIDLDGFKAVNDTRGHAAGDALLVGIAAAVRAVAQEVDSVARLGGDEFAVLCRQRVEPERSRLAHDLCAAVARAGAEHGVTASVGWTALRAEDGPALALQRADAAMYEAKQSGGDRARSR